MVGTLVGGITQIGEAGSTGILYFNPDATGPMVEGSGRILMVIFVIVIVAPLCALKNLRRVSCEPCNATQVSVPNSALHDTEPALPHSVHPAAASLHRSNSAHASVQLKV